MQKLQKWCIEHMLYPWMETHRGNRILENLRRLQDLEQASPETRQAAQSAALQELLVRCAQHVPAYRKLGWTEEEIRSDPYGVLKRAPALKKSDFRDRTDEFLTEGIDSSSRIPNLTGGSTAARSISRWTGPRWKPMRAARWRGLSWFGVTPGSRSVMVWGSPVELGKAKQKRYLLQEQLLKNRRILSAYDLRPEKAPEYVKFLNRYGRNTSTDTPRRSMPWPASLSRWPGSCGSVSKLWPPHPRRCSLAAGEDRQGVFLPGGQRVRRAGRRDPGLQLPMRRPPCDLGERLDRDPGSGDQRACTRRQLGVIAVTDLHNRVQPRLRYLLATMAR